MSVYNLSSAESSKKSKVNNETKMFHIRLSKKG